MSQLKGLTPKKLCQKLGIETGYLYWLADNVDDLYRSAYVEELDRTLTIPDKQLKEFQGKFYDHYLKKYDFHDVVYCCPGRGIHDAVSKHKKHSHFLHLDIESFYPTVSYTNVKGALKGVGINKGFVPTLTRLMTVNNELPQGAPTSVALGNLVLERMDRRLGGFCRKHGLTYTRYIDDFAISGGSRLEKYESNIRGIIDEAGWPLNNKGGLYGPDEDHNLHGLIAGVEVNVGREYLKELETLIRDLETGKIEKHKIDERSLRGKIDWVKLAEPETGDRLESNINRTLSPKKTVTWK